MERERRRGKRELEAAIVTLALSDFSPFSEQREPPRLAEPVGVDFPAESPWHQRIEVIARFMRKEVAEIVADPEAAREAAMYWDTLEINRRLRVSRGQAPAPHA